jgi:hypothetical protein
MSFVPRVFLPDVMKYELVLVFYPTLAQTLEAFPKGIKGGKFCLS